MNLDKIGIFFDYTCGDSYRLKSVIDLLEQAGRIEAAWSTFSLKQKRLAEGEPSPFDAAHIDSLSILALALAHALREQEDADFALYHTEVYRALHEEDHHLAPEDVMAIAAGAGLDIGAFKSDQQRWLKSVASEHQNAEARWGIFGTPTVIFDESLAVYAEVGAPVSRLEDAERVIDSIRDFADGPAQLVHLERP